MLKARKLQRRRKLVSYLKVLKKKSKQLQQHYDIQIKVENQQQADINKKQQNNELIQQPIMRQSIAWHDSDDENLVNLNRNNSVKKLKRNDEQITQAQYQQRLKQFKNNRYQDVFNNWAKEGEAQNQRDYEDILNQQLVDKALKTQNYSIKYFGKTQKKHQSIVTGVDWYNNVFFTTGLDKTLKIWSIAQDRPESQTNIKLEKTIYYQNIPLTNCVCVDKKLYLGTLRKNYAIFDIEKNTSQLITSSFLESHKSYQQLRAKNNYIGIFSQQKISLLSNHNSFVGQLQANEPITDMTFMQNQVVATTKEGIYRWDLRKLRILQVLKQSLGNTAISISPSEDMISVGSSCGMIYLYEKKDNIGKLYKQIPNLTTSITGITSNYDGSLIIGYSKWKKNAVRVIESNNNSVLSTWPSMHTKIGYASAVKFSKDSKFICVGSTNGSSSIYKFEEQQ